MDGGTHRRSVVPDSLAPRSRLGTTVGVHLLTWDFAVLEVQRGTAAPVYVPRPAEGLEDFLADVEHGRADGWIHRVADRRPRPVLRRVRRTDRRLAAGCVGVEHEYTVLEGGEPADFKRLLPTLGLPGLRADPVDPNAHRCEWGGVITADGIEAEVATPPVPIGRGGIAETIGYAGAGRAFLEAHLGPGRSLEGFSTHINVSVPRRGDARLARRYCETFAPALALLLDQADSPGLLVRPRPGRLELCGEFADGERLRVALTFATASALALAAAPGGFRGLRVTAAPQPSRQRFGFYLAPDAFGEDLYRGGRGTPLLRLAGRGHQTVSAQDQLAACWARCRPAVDGRLDPEDLDAVDRVVHATTPLPASLETAYLGAAPQPSATPERVVHLTSQEVET